MVFALCLAGVVLLRAGELLLSRRNGRWLLRNGAVEYGKAQYPFIVALHTLFFLSMLFEYSKQDAAAYSIWLLLVYVFLLAFKTWAIASLGTYWNTRIYRIAGASLVRTGPYRYLKHPNYLIVIGEIAVLPLAFHLYWTAALFTVLNAIVLYVRIREENLALRR
jgi:methyltransferase